MRRRFRFPRWWRPNVPPVPAFAFRSSPSTSTVDAHGVRVIDRVHVLSVGPVLVVA